MRLSVVIPSINGYEYLSQCLDSLGRQTSPPDEVIVVDSTPDRAASRVAAFNGLRVHTLNDRLGVPEMRSIGLGLATGDVVALTEDHCIPADDWCERICEIHAQHPEEVIGGAVENGSTQTLVDWACYFCEYLEFMLPLTHAPAGGVPGNNVAYKRSLLDRYRDLFSRGEWEFFIHGELAKDDVKFRMDPGIVVMHAKRFRIADFQSQSYHFARAFGAERARLASPGRLWAYRFLLPALPALGLFRLIRKIHEKKRHLRQFWLSLPWTAYFQLCWWAGEVIGCWLGDGGNAGKVPLPHGRV